jgi:hypothetical protein
LHHPASTTSAFGASRPNIFSWQPEQRYDVVFFGFWLSHVPPQRFESFSALVADCLKPDGRVFFADDADRTPHELVYKNSSPIVRRRSSDGTAYSASSKCPTTSTSLRNDSGSSGGASRSPGLPSRSSGELVRSRTSEGSGLSSLQG